MRVNLWGPVHGVEAFVPRMIEQGGDGYVLFTSSFAGIVPNRNLGPYNVTKAGVVALAESLRKNLSETAIGVSVLCPMRVSTNIDRSYRNRPTELGRKTSAYSEDERASLVGRPLEPDLVADLVLDAIQRDQMYIHTHKEAEALVRRRAERLCADFTHAL